MENLQTVETLTRRRTSQTLKTFHGRAKIAVMFCMSAVLALVVVLTSPTPSQAISLSLVTPIPEPSTLILLGFGLIGLAAWTRRMTK